MTRRPRGRPDGRRIAFETKIDGDREIYVMNADGTNVRQLTHNTLWDEGPAWSPDGTSSRSPAAPTTSTSTSGP